MTPFETTVIGSMPKPTWLYSESTRSWQLEGEALGEAQDDATRVAIRDQERAGIDITLMDTDAARKTQLATNRLLWLIAPTVLLEFDL